MDTTRPAYDSITGDLGARSLRYYFQERPTLSATLPVPYLSTYRPIRGGHEKPSFRLGGGGRLQNAPSANAFL